MALRAPFLFLAVLASSCVAADLSGLPTLLKTISADVFPGLRTISEDIFTHPEISRNETHAHDAVVAYFTKGPGAGQWKVTPHAYGERTAWALDFVHRPAGFGGVADADIPAVGFMSEYDALIGIGHACGHHLIALNGLTAAELTRAALLALDVPGRVRLVGTPDEENTAGKARLAAAGAFDGIHVWLMAHPTLASAVQPMQARDNVLADFAGATHAAAVQAAYEAMVRVTDLTGTLPGSQSSATIVEDVGMFACNVVQQVIQLGVAGLSLDEVKAVVDSILDSTYPSVNYTAAADAEVENGVALTILGPGGHASESTKTPLRLSIETFRKLTASGDDVTFFLPGNTTALKLDITVSARTRYTLDLPALTGLVEATIGSAAASTSTDLQYPALEVDPTLAGKFIALMATADYGSQSDWAISTITPAATDAGYVQVPEVDAASRQLLSVGAVVLHPNFNICDKAAEGGACPFPHEPKFRDVAGKDFAFNRTEVVARAEAQLAVEIIADAAFRAEVTTLVRK